MRVGPDGYGKVRARVRADWDGEGFGTVRAWAGRIAPKCWEVAMRDREKCRQ